jgi:peptidoglycan-N-acetylglucosamine deacetylase
VKRWIWVAAGAIGVLVGCVFGLRALVEARGFQLFGKLVDRVETTDRRVALTFDDGPVPEVTDTILRVLSARGVHATFFLMGAMVERAPQLAPRLIAAGHELGNHTYSHKRMLLKSPGFIRAEVERTDSLIRAAGYTKPIYFRPPFGDKLVGLPWYLWRTGRTTVMWDIEPDSKVTFTTKPEDLVRHVLDRVQPGSIIILHIWYASRYTSFAAVGPMIDSLQARGYRVGTVGELLAGVRSSP